MKKIYSTKWKDKNFKDMPEYPCFLLVDREFDDYGFHTLYKLYFLDEDKNEEEIGEIRILNTEDKHTILASSFPKLPETFCSLGDSFEFYEKLVLLKESYYEFFLDSVNDVVRYPEIGKRYYGVPGFKKSLLRYSTSEKVFEEGHRLFSKINFVPITDFSFAFLTDLPGASGSHKVSLNFGKKQEQHSISRVIAWIGKNGTGKTLTLANLATALSGQNTEVGSFEPKRPSFDRVIAISYSAFDSFERPESSSKFSYHYLGLKNEAGVVDPSSLKPKIRNNILGIIKRGKLNAFKKVLESTMGERLFPFEEVRDGNNFLLKIISDQKINCLSSGQMIALSIISGIIAVIEKQSLILFDEPETHLHPNAIHSLIKSIGEVLELEDSYMIISTHSPILLQDIESKNIRVFEREGSLPSIREPHLECLGENISTIIDEVFRVTDEESGYKNQLKKLKELPLRYDEIIGHYHNRLSINARVYLKNLFK